MRGKRTPKSELFLGFFQFQIIKVKVSSNGHYIHEVTPSVVAIAVMIERMSCKISFQVSFFMMIMFRVECLKFSVLMFSVVVRGERIG